MFMRYLAPEDVVAIPGVSEDDREQNNRTDEQKRLRFRCRGGLTERNLEWYDVRPHADEDTEIARQKYTEA